jgi:hypothetical protein
MESIEEILTCKICMERFNDEDKKPLFVPCGHTFCSRCLRFIYKRPNLRCPLDKKEHKVEAFTNIPINFSVLNCLHSQIQNNNEGLKLAGDLKRKEKKCEKHPNDSLKFYCQTD